MKTGEKCGECTLCCYLLTVPAMNKKAGVLCQACVLKKGCKIYTNRPQECKEFKCAYYQMEKVNISLRPDNCKMIFEKVSDQIFLGTQDPRFEITEVARKQIRQFNLQGFSVIVSHLDKKLDTYLAPNHSKVDIQTEFRQSIKERYGHIHS